MLSVIVVDHNAGPLLARNLRRLRETWPASPDAEIIVVDNASDDGSVEAVEALAAGPGPSLRVLRNTDNRGFAAACNQGIARARGDFLLFLNPDVTVDAPDVLAVRAVLHADPDAGMAGLRLLNPDGSEQRGARRAIPDARRAFWHFSGLSRLFPGRFPDFNAGEAPLPAVPVPVEAVSGAFMLVRRAAMEQVGGWDEGFFLHGEDLDWCLRFGKAGYRILFVPGATAVHAQGTCSRRRPVWVEWHKHRGMWRFYRKHQAPEQAVAMRVLVATGISLHFLLRTVRLLPRLLAGSGSESHA